MKTHDVDGIRIIARRDLPVPCYSFGSCGRLVVLVRSESEELDGDTRRLVAEEVARRMPENASAAHIDETCRTNPHM